MQALPMSGGMAHLGMAAVQEERCRYADAG